MHRSSSLPLRAKCAASPRFHLLGLAALALLLACTSRPAVHAPDAGLVVWKDFVEWQTGLAKLDSNRAEFVTNFADSIPSQLPDSALPQVNFLDFDGAVAPGFVASPSVDGMTRVSFVIGNPSQRANRTESVLCFLNQRQHPCRLGVNGWSLSIPARSFAFLPLDIDARTGDRIDVFLVPSNQPGYPFPSSLGFPAFVQRKQDMIPQSDLAPRSRVWPFEGCGSAHILQTQPPIQEQKLPVNVMRDTPLYLDIELCQPDQVVRLVAIANRQEEVLVNAPVWQAPVKIHGTTALIPIDSSWFADANELQIAVVMNDFGSGQSAIMFSDAVSFAH